jgi:RHS repeat-associated protein
MPMPGRNYNSTDYRFGFNGKEKLDELHGNSGDAYDYGMRIYDARLCRFMSVDPLAKNFPELTPYQYASNRPIDGIDFDGLEYLTYRILLKDGGQTVIEVIDHTKMTNDEIKAVHGMSQEDFLKKYSVSFGKKGQGILYEYYVEKDGKQEKVSESFEFAEKGLYGKLSHYGKFAGPGCVTECGEQYNQYDSDNQGDSYDFSQQPIDAVDAAAKKHDQQYGTIRPYTDYHTVEGLEYDKEFVSTLKQYLKDAKSKDYKDPYTGRPASKDAIRNAKLAIFYFEKLLIPPKEKEAKTKGSSGN